MAKFQCVVKVSPGVAAQTFIIEAVNPPQARQIAEAQTGGQCLSANQLGGG